MATTGAICHAYREFSIGGLSPLWSLATAQVGERRLGRQPRLLPTRDVGDVGEQLLFVGLPALDQHAAQVGVDAEEVPRRHVAAQGVREPDALVAGVDRLSLPSP